MLAALAILEWTAPSALSGLAAVALPIAAHLWSRRVGPPAWFSTIRFVLAAERRMTRRHLWHDRLLMALRCAIVVLAVLALAQPVWRSGQAAAQPPVPEGARGGADRHVAIVLDASASMRQVVAGRTLFEHAKDKAAELLRSGKVHGIRASVVIAGDGDAPRKLWPHPSARVEALAEAVAELAPGFGRADLADAVRRVNNEVAIVHVITDGQRISRTGLMQLAEDRTITEHRVGDGASTANLTVTQPRLAPARPVEGRDALFSVDVANHGDDTATARVMIDGPFGSLSRRVELEAGQRATVNQAVRFDTTRTSMLSARLSGDDALSVDDRVDLLALPRGPVRVAIVGESVDVDDAGSAAFYLARAIEPGGAGPYRLIPPDAAQQQPGRIDMFITLNEAVPAVRKHVESGAGWLAIGARHDDAEARSEPATLSLTDRSRRPWRLFEGEALGTLVNVTFERTYTAQAGKHAQTLATWPDGEPAVTTRPLGTGRMVHFAASLTPNHTNLVRSPAFVPLVHELLAMLRSQAPDATTLVGHRLDIVLPPDVEPHALQLVAPNDSAMDGPIRSTPTGMRLTGPAVTRPGVYRVVDGDGRAIAAATALVDPRESDLHMAPPLPDPDASVGPGTATTDGELQSMPVQPTSHALWPWCLAGALVLAMAESLVAGIDRRPSTRRQQHDAEIDLYDAQERAA